MHSVLMPIKSRQYQEPITIYSPEWLDAAPVIAARQTSAHVAKAARRRLDALAKENADAQSVRVRAARRVAAKRHRLRRLLLRAKRSSAVRTRSPAAVSST